MKERDAARAAVTGLSECQPTTAVVREEAPARARTPGAGDLANDAEHVARVYLDTGTPVPAAVVHVLLERLALYRKRVTLGGPPPGVDSNWANANLPAPASASDDTAPPIRTGRGSHRARPSTVV